MRANLADRQLETIPWDQLRAGAGFAQEVADDLRRMLFSAEAEEVRQAYRHIENPVVAQGSLFQCAPAVVSVIVGGVADGCIPSINLGPVLDLLGLILGGEADPSEVAEGWGDLRARCQAEALRGYWSLVKLSTTPDPYGVSKIAADLVELLDEDQPSRRLP